MARQVRPMSHTILVEVYSAACPWLGLVWCLLRLAGIVKQPLRGWSLLAVTGAIAAALLLVPVEGIVVARWIAGFNANFSTPRTGMLAVIVWQHAIERSVVSEGEWTTALGFGAIGGLALYPMALGLGGFDPYEWGWTLSPLFVVIGVLTAWWIWRGNRFGYLLLLAAAACHLRLLESTNYWDYLLDPIYSLVSLGWLTGRLAASMRSSLTKRNSKTLPRSISTS
jgi:hypothetical protein